MGKVVKEVGGAQGQANLTLPGLMAQEWECAGECSVPQFYLPPAEISDAASVLLPWLRHALFSSGAC